MAYVSLGSRSRPLTSLGGGSGSRGGSGGGSGGGAGTAFSSGGLGTSMMGMARSTSTAGSDSMKPPPGECLPLWQPAAALTWMQAADLDCDKTGMLSALSL